MSETRKSNLLGKITVLVVICFFALSAEGKYGGGSGISNDPYLIYDVNQMNQIGLSGNQVDWDKHFKLMADIDLSEYTGTSFNIIGTSWDNAFTGVFDGNGHTISNFSYTYTGTDYIGLFRCVSGVNAEIKNLELIDPNVDAGTGDFVGSLVGLLGVGGGTITNCYVDGGRISGGDYVGGLVGYNSHGTVTDCDAISSVSGGRCVGGLVGYNSSSTITNCYSSGSVEGYYYIGGLVGYNYDGTITTSFSTGSITGNNDVGGLVGWNYGTITNCYSTGSVAGSFVVGGLVGTNGYCYYSNCYSGIISNCYSTGSVTGTTDVGGLVGYNEEGKVLCSFWDIETSEKTWSSGGMGKTTSEIQTAITFSSWGCVGSFWTIDDGNDYPRLWWENKPGELITTPSYGGGSGEPNDPYLIYTAEQLNMIGLTACHHSKYFKLMADIYLSGFTGTSFNIIGYFVDLYSPDNKPFTGVFDGNGHTISNFTYTSPGTSYIGLFTCIDGDAEIKDLVLIDPNVDVGTGDSVGSLVGRVSGGTITNCYVKGGSVSGDQYVGGLVGWNRDTIFNCCSTGSVSGYRIVGGLVGRNSSSTITNCYSTGNVSGYVFVGGLVGYNSSSAITYCYSTGSVSGYSFVGGLVGYNTSSAITNCYSEGNVSGSKNVGGIVGYNIGEVMASFWDIETSGQSTSAGGTGLPTAEMQTMRTFYDAGWGCEPVWTIDEGVDYPRLVWENKPGELITVPSDLYGGGTGEPNDPYLIYSAEQLNKIGLFTCHWDKDFKLMEGIDLGVFTGTSFNIIGYRVGWINNKPFTGVFDGNGHTISNFTCTSTGTDYIGLFGYVTGEIKNLGVIDPNVNAGTGISVGSLVGINSGRITNCYVKGSSVTGHLYVGGLVGYNYDGTISNCYVEGGSVSGDSYVGGLVGENDGIISHCYSTASVEGDEIVGGLVGENDYSGTIANCYSKGSVSGDEIVGGLIGYNDRGTIINSYSTSSVTGRYDRVGGLMGENDRGSITGCYATGNVTGYIMVGGLAGKNLRGEITDCYAKGETIKGYSAIGGLVGENGSYSTIINCYSTGSIVGDYSVGGFVGFNYGTITNCYSTGSVWGEGAVGGLVGETYDPGTITNCYATGSVSGNNNAGGLVGENGFFTTITNCYSTGSVSGVENVGGLVGGDYGGKVTNSFWDIETSGQEWSGGGTGLPTAEMQTMSIFTDTGWDFVGETVNGVEDIWWILEGVDYPRLWWEGMQVPMKLTPRTLNCRSQGNWVKAHLTLPKGFTVADVDPDRPAVLHSFGFESAPLYVFVNKDKLVEIEAAFERQAVCSLAGNWPQALTVVGFMADGNIFLGTSTVRIIHPGMNVIEELASCWLQGDCVHPTWCGRIDMNRDSLVNLHDYALLMNIEVEFVTDE